ncbi:MAG TPA: hypothetical protein VK858_01565 [Longimicrobiales bacterium]|nr:hypothetical protein [Longimicrobiales bacterium]
MTSGPTPSDAPVPSRSFFQELRRRHVVRSALAYAAVVFVLLQLAEIVLPAFGTGVQAEATIRILVVGAVLLLPVVLAAAWVWEITPRGIRSMRDLDAEAGIDSGGSLGHRAAFLGVTLAAVAAAGVWWWQTEEGLPAGGGALPASTATPFVAASTADDQGPIGSLAVLPLEDLSGDEEDYFALGMHEAILSEVSRIGTLRVISRTSVMQFSQEGKSLPQIGAELGVDAIVEGSVLRSGERVRITVQLIHAASDTHIWAESYERDLDDVIGLQREVAQAITEEIRSQVEARLGGEQGVAGVDLAAAPPEPRATGARVASSVPAEAQEAVMRGRVSLFDETEVPSAPDVPGVQDVPGVGEAEGWFREALAMDSAFVPALSGLAGTLVIQGMESGEAGRAQVEAAREMAVRALEIDPGNPEAAEILEGARAALQALYADIGDSVEVLVAPNTPLGMTIHRYIAEAEMREGSEDPRARVRPFLRLLGVGRIHEALDVGEDLMDEGVRDPLLWEGMEQGWRITGELGEVLEVVDRRDGEVPARALAEAVDRSDLTGYWAWKRAWIADRDAAGVPVSPTVRATGLLAVDDVSGAMEWLRRAATERDPLLGLIRHDRTWDRVRGSRAFGEALQEARRGGL